MKKLLFVLLLVAVFLVAANPMPSVGQCSLSVNAPFKLTASSAYIGTLYAKHQYPIVQIVGSIVQIDIGNGVSVWITKVSCG